MYRSGHGGVRPLREDETLVFLHIPKTGGVTLSTLLYNRFPPGTVRSFDNFRAADGRITDAPEEVLRTCRSLRSHEDYDTIRSHLKRNAVWVTMLRDPVARVVSHFQFQLRLQGRVIPEDPDEWTREFLAYFDGFYWERKHDNRHVRTLAGAIDGPMGRRPQREWLPAAKARLESMDVVGLTERMRDSISMLTYTLDLEPFVLIPRLNEAPPKYPSRTLAPDIEREIRKRESLDLELSRFGCELFEDRLRRIPPSELRRHRPHAAIRMRDRLRKWIGWWLPPGSVGQQAIGRMRRRLSGGVRA